MAACRLAVGDKRPFEPRKRPVVGNIDETAKFTHAGDHRIGGVGNLVKIVAGSLDPDRQRPPGPCCCLVMLKSAPGRPAIRSRMRSIRLAAGVTLSQSAKTVRMVPTRSRGT